MNSAGNKKIITLVLIAIFGTIPLTSALAQVDPFGGFVPTQVPGVPVADAPLQSKDVGISILGVSIPGITWDGLFIRALVKPVIETMVNDTINWAASGFYGNPAYVTDPAQYFGDIADGVAGEFIRGSDLGFLCSPFQARIRLSLLTAYIQKPVYQCTLTGVVGNIDAFYNNFAEGGWNGWFAMTQNDVNNPYGAYLIAKADMDSRLTQALALRNRELIINNDFLSWRDCYEYDPDTGKCMPGMESGIITPGSAFQSKLEKVLDTDLTQLELADELDEVINAVLIGLLKRTVMSAQGLFR